MTHPSQSFCSDNSSGILKSEQILYPPLPPTTFHLSDLHILNALLSNTVQYVIFIYHDVLKQYCQHLTVEIRGSVKNFPEFFDINGLVHHAFVPP
jgi:hypothetical protein